MNLLWLSHFIPYPPRGGAPQRSFNLLRQAAARHRVTLIAFNRPTVERATLRTYGSELKRFCAHVEFWNLPVVWKGPHWWMRLACSPLFARPYSCRMYWSPALAERWRKVLVQHQPELVHVDSADLTLFLEDALRYPVFLNHHNCESAMATRRADLEKNPLKRLFLQDQARKLARIERDFCARVSGNGVVSYEDGELLRSVSPQAHVHVVANGSDTAYFVPQPAAVEAASIIFSGSFSWYPNRSAVRYFGREIWPALKERAPGIRFYLAGQNPPQWLVTWAQHDPAVILVNTPADIRPWIARAAVFVCPILDGGGTRLKIIDAMAMGKAVVSTGIGCEGLRVSPGTDILVARSTQEFVDQVLWLLAHPAERERVGVNARRLVESEYSWERIGLRLDEAYACAMGGACDAPLTPHEGEGIGGYT